MEETNKSEVKGGESMLVRGLNFVGERILHSEIIRLSAILGLITVAGLVGKWHATSTYIPDKMEIRYTSDGSMVYINNRAQPQMFYDPNVSSQNKIVFIKSRELSEKFKDTYDLTRNQR